MSNYIPQITICTITGTRPDPSYTMLVKKGVPTLADRGHLMIFRQHEKSYPQDIGWWAINRDCLSHWWSCMWCGNTLTWGDVSTPVLIHEVSFNSLFSTAMSPLEIRDVINITMDCPLRTPAFVWCCTKRDVLYKRKWYQCATFRPTVTKRLIVLKYDGPYWPHTITTREIWTGLHGSLFYSRHRISIILTKVRLPCGDQ